MFLLEVFDVAGHAAKLTPAELAQQLSKIYLRLNDAQWKAALTATLAEVERRK